MSAIALRTSTIGHSVSRLLGLMTLLAFVAVTTATQGLATGPQSVADLAERLSPAVVNISTSQTD